VVRSEIKFLRFLRLTGFWSSLEERPAPRATHITLEAVEDNQILAKGACFQQDGAVFGYGTFRDFTGIKSKKCCMNAVKRHSLSAPTISNEAVLRRRRV
jgi:hypothetical protein